MLLQMKNYMKERYKKYKIRLENILFDYKLYHFINHTILRFEKLKVLLYNIQMKNYSNFMND